MYTYSIYLKIRIKEFDTTGGINLMLPGHNAAEVAEMAKHFNKDKDIIYIEVANTQKEESIKFFDGETLELFKEM